MQSAFLLSSSPCLYQTWLQLRLTVKTRVSLPLPQIPMIQKMSFSPSRGRIWDLAVFKKFVLLLSTLWENETILIPKTLTFPFHSKVMMSHCSYDYDHFSLCSSPAICWWQLSEPVRVTHPHLCTGNSDSPTSREWFTEWKKYWGIKELSQQSPWHTRETGLSKWHLLPPPHPLKMDILI